jgi:LacI family transcriptional regulator
MHRQVVPTTPLRVPPFQLVVRKSSDLMAVNHPAIARSLRFLCEHYREPIGVNDLARIASMSTRRFHQAFTRHVGRAPGTEIHRVRIECGKKLLRDSDERMARIAEQCGFRCSNTFGIAFKHATGMSPRQYRNQRIASTWRAFSVKSKIKRT